MIIITAVNHFCCQAPLGSVPSPTLPRNHLKSPLSFRLLFSSLTTPHPHHYMLFPLDFVHPCLACLSQSRLPGVCACVCLCVCSGVWGFFLAWVTGAPLCLCADAGTHSKGTHVSLWELICTPLSSRYYVSQWYFIPSPLSNLCLWGETGMWAKDENLKVCFHLQWEDHMMWSSVLLDCSSMHQWFFFFSFFFSPSWYLF